MHNKEKTDCLGLTFDIWIRKARLHNIVLTPEQVEMLYEAWDRNESYLNYRYLGQNN
jgi:hypothetical protein